MKIPYWRAYGLSLAAAPQKGALRAAFLPPVGSCAIAQGSASPNPVRTSVHLSLLPLRACGLSLAAAPQKGALRAALFAAGRILRYRARLFEPEPRPHELIYMPALRAGSRFEPYSGTKKGSTNQNVLPFLVPLVGLEPTRYRYHWILSPARLPISPQRQM